jgi:hypothetical protein
MAVTASPAVKPNWDNSKNIVLKDMSYCRTAFNTIQLHGVKMDYLILKLTEIKVILYCFQFLFTLLLLFSYLEDEIQYRKFFWRILLILTFTNLLLPTTKEFVFMKQIEKHGVLV